MTRQVSSQVCLGTIGVGAEGVASSEGGEIVVAVDARIDDRKELCRRLGLPVHSHHSERAEALVLRAYERFGDQCASSLIGAFAFVISDTRRGILLCARDHAGFRSLYYHHGPGGFIVATDVEGVIAGLDGSARLDHEALLAREVHLTSMLRERSLYVGISKVLPGGALIVERGGNLRRFEHWSAQPRSPIRHADPREYSEQLRSTIDLAVSDAVATEQPVAAHVSGGIDSSGLAAMAQSVLKRDSRELARLFSWSPTPGCDGDLRQSEHGRVLAVASWIGAPLEWTDISARDVQLQLELAASYHAANGPEEQEVLRRAASIGVGVLISGWGGDELASHSGRGHLADLFRRRQWSDLRRELTIPTDRSTSWTRMQALRRAAKLCRNEIVVPLLPTRAAARWVAANSWDRRLERERGLPIGGVHHQAARLQRLAVRANLPIPSVAEMQLRQLRNGHLEARMEVWARAGAAAGGVEYRYPLLDRRVVELCLSFPGEAWLRDGISRRVFREAVDPFLPPGFAFGPTKSEPSRIASVTRLSAEAQLPEGSDPILIESARRGREIARMIVEELDKPASSRDKRSRFDLRRVFGSQRH